jgi:hypothetical protein
MSTSRRAARQPRPQPQQPNTAAETQAAPTTPPPATPTVDTGADECRVATCTKPPLQGGVCYRHFLEGHRG